MRNYLIAYDVRDPRRLRRVYRCLKEAGLHLQYSVFVAQLGRKGVERLMDRLAELIDPRVDDVRIYPVPENPKWRWLGPAPLPDDVFLFTGGRSLVTDDPGALVRRDTAPRKVSSNDAADSADRSANRLKRRRLLPRGGSNRDLMKKGLRLATSV